MPWIKISDATASQDRYIRRTKEFIKTAGIKNSVVVQEGDLILSNSATPGIPKILRIEACIHDGWLLFRDLKVDRDYLYYFLIDSLKEFRHSASGTVFKNLKTDIVKRVRIFLPPLQEQKKIAGILGSLDDKIELLRKESETLEKLAQTLFKRWFVDFEFPADCASLNHAGRPVSSASPAKGGERGSVKGYKSSGGKMIDSKLGPIPEGWRAGNLGDCLSLEYGKPLKEEDRTGSGYPVYGSNGVVGYHKDYFVEGEGIVVGRKGSMGALEWVEENFFPIDTSFFVKDRLDINKLFFHYLLLQRQDLKKVGSDSAVPGLNRNAAYSIDVVVPSNIVIKAFHDLLTPIFQKRKNNNDQIKSLSVSRDILLPWLMNGSLR